MFKLQQEKNHLCNQTLLRSFEEWKNLQMPYSSPLTCSNSQYVTCSFDVIPCGLLKECHKTVCAVWVCMAREEKTFISTVKVLVPLLSTNLCRYTFLMRYSTAYTKSLKQPTLVVDLFFIEKKKVSTVELISVAQSCHGKRNAHYTRPSHCCLSASRFSVFKGQTKTKL